MVGVIEGGGNGMLRLASPSRAVVIGHAEATYPHECCGFLLGRVLDGEKQVVDVLPAGNTRDDSPRNRYRISPDEFVSVERDSRERGLEIVGFYHSHPEAPPRPSEYDRTHAWPWYTYLIVPVNAGRAGVSRAWVLMDSGEAFEEEAIA